MLVEAWLERAARLHPELPALETPHGAHTYAQLLADVRTGVAELDAAGVSPGDRVAIALPAGLDFARALHATLLLGAVAVPLDLRLGEEESRARLEGVRAVIDEPLAASAAAASTDGASRAASPELRSPHQHDLASTAMIVYSSGTSAAPKAVPLSYGNFLWSALGSAVALDLAPAERWLCAMPLSHVAGLSILVRSVIYGTTAVVHEHFDTAEVLRALREREITLVSLVATTLQRLLDAGLAQPPALRCALTGGGPVPSELIARARAAGVPVRLTYGLTEACSQVATTPVAAADGGVRPLFCTRVQSARGSEEVLVRAPTVASECADENGWLHTGDLGRLDAAGHLHISGRESDTIISGGEKVVPGEVEEVLAAHPDVMEAAVIGEPDGRWGELVSAVVVARPGARLDRDALRRHCALHLARYKLPKRLEVVAGPLPRTGSGKLLRRELRASTSGADGAPLGDRAVAEP
jgi:o-succinylbenzoate---CoA ligase